MKKVICLALCFVMVIFSFTSCSSKKICLNDYVTITFRGEDGKGMAHATLDKDKFYLDYASKIDFKDSQAEKAFKALHNNKISKAIYGEDLEPVAILYVAVCGVKLDTASYNMSLKNGDKVKIHWDIDYETISKFLDVDKNDIVAYEETFIVSGLKAPSNKDYYSSYDYYN